MNDTPTLRAAGRAPVLNRRTFMMTTAASAGVAAGCGAAAATPDASANPHAGSQATRVTVNGRPYELALEPRASLLDVLREQLGLTGAKKGCDHGQCGACTVHVDGRCVASCLTLAVKTDGCAVTTIEGVESPHGTLHPMQQFFVDHDALQCGYCTPGQVMAAIACVREGHATTDAQIREYMSGNICRCGAYAGILEAIREAAPQMRRLEGTRNA
ncbi:MULTISPECIES: (2Fe-2S)-binding protein [unclassified Variovorax]|uniref:(2Fe-2S)-binding protein n=1 Tax=unclassified Variovorax TaxID=663243 RepID=UPI000837AFC1|nr:MULTISPECIES: (2Fe-2S)-binding protein [unclassified Variovorax]PNG56796.1 putative xanthine dehydrogenase YagT iron-sulfur-binding subunit [Variovorax sp. B4]PNG58220.1 putative xanthine dehydrogenase YagT iron-sulfur-binding subunit [Variovorax sp. B2]VTV09268.1 Carbon monoxide dehydrogenase small chain [Variovorax sp. WDL1]